MDPLDARLTAVGSDWRRSQPEPPDLDRMIAGLDLRRRPASSSRLAFLLVAGLLALTVFAVASGAGGFLRNGLPGVVTPTPSVPACVDGSACPSSPAATPLASIPPSGSPQPSSPPPSDSARATALLEAYQSALVAGEWRTAFDLLAPTAPTSSTGFAAYADEREAFYASVAGRFTIDAPTSEIPESMTPLLPGADRSRAFLIEVDYPALAGNNAGYEQFVVAPDGSGVLRIWPVR
jgi:hypothetical protein